MKHIVIIFVLLTLCGNAFGQGSFTVPKPDSIGVDTDGDGTVDGYIYPAHLKKGSNITFTLTGDTLTIAGPSSSGTADSMGVDTDGNGTVDAYLYSTIAGAFHLKKGSNITLTVAGDTVTIAGSGGGLSYWTESDDNDTSVFTATGPNTIVGFNDNMTLQGNSITGVLTLEVGGDITLDDGTTDSPSLILRDQDNKFFQFKKDDDGYAVFLNNEASIRFNVSNDVDDYIYFDTSAADVPMISTGGNCDLVVNASSGEISFGDENLTTTGTLDAGATSVTGNIAVTGTVDTVDVAALGATVSAISIADSIGDSLPNYFDTAAVVDTIEGWVSAQGYLNALNEVFAYFDRTYFDTLIDASGDSITCVYSDSTDLSIFDTDDLTQGASNKYDQALPDSGEWSIAYDSSQEGYLNPVDPNVDTAAWNAGGSGEANTLSDTGTFNGTEGFGLAGGKTGTALKVKGLIEGSNITIAASGDSAYTITSSGSAAWVASNDTMFLVDADGDTLAAFWDDDAGNVKWQVGTEDQTLHLLADTIGIGKTSPDEILHLFGNNATLKLEDDSENDATISVGNSQLCIAIDPGGLVASSDICFDIDGDEVARLHQNTNFGIGIGATIPPERISVVGNIATGDTTTGDVDVFHYFSTDGSWNAEWLVWDDGDARFELSDDFYVAGNISLTGSITGYFDTAAVVDTAQALDNIVLSKIRDTVMAVLDTIWFGMTIDNPDGLTKDSVMVLAVNAEWAPSGITLLSVGIKTWAATSYSVDFIEFTEPGDGGTESAIETVATSTSREAEDDGTLTDADIAAGSIIVVDLPATDIDQVQVWGTFTVD